MLEENGMERYVSTQKGIYKFLRRWMNVKRHLDHKYSKDYHIYMR